MSSMQDRCFQIVVFGNMPPKTINLTTVDYCQWARWFDVVVWNDLRHPDDAVCIILLIGLGESLGEGRGFPLAGGFAVFLGEHP